MFEIVPGGEVEMFYSTDGKCADSRIGHVRFDFGDGYEFWSSWWPGQANDEHNTEAFSAELTSIVGFLRKDLLRSAEMASRISNRLRLPLIDGDRRYYGCHIQTPQHAYYLRLSPNRGDYNYIYCYHQCELTNEK